MGRADERLAAETAADARPKNVGLKAQHDCPFLEIITCSPFLPAGQY